MTKTIITTAATILLLIGGAACKPATPGTLPVHPAITANDLGEFFTDEPAAPAAPAVVTWPNDGQSHGDIEPPTRLDISGVEQAECNDMGGTYVGPATSGSLGTCQGVDY